MKILGTLFRLLCALVVLLAAAVYLDGPLQVSLVDYIGAFTPEHLTALANPEGWPVIAAGAILLLTLCCGLQLGWNIFYSLATLAFFAEVALMTLEPELALPSATRGLGWEPMLRELALNYPVPALMVPCLCILGCLCSSAPVRIAWTSLVSCALCYGCAELLHYGAQYWQSMPEPALPQVLEFVKGFPWVLAAVPAVFFLQYSLFMAMFETFIPRRKKGQKKAQGAGQAEDNKQEDKKVEKPADAPEVPASKTTIPVIAKPVVVKKPIIHKKSPVAAEPAAEAKKEADKPEDKPEEKPEEKKEEPKADSPAEEKKPEAPAAEEKPAEEAPKADSPADEKKPEAPAAPQA